MEAVRIAAGANILKGTTHPGIDRVSAGMSVARTLLSSAIRALDTWHETRVAAHNAALMAQLAAQDHRVLKDLRAAWCRAEQKTSV